MTRDERIRELADQMWNSAGRPEGQEKRYLKQAQDIVTGFDGPDGGERMREGSIQSSVAPPMPKSDSQG
ncbi:DUF2934 domain-containing protein [Stutzerimonas urumqiensis]|uniref:DUF2934 domain-containing protein n=1 Tax=Stutzerimonas urumqiensis TaxID=638269 RepID=UPI000EAF1F62|nr:DUF2934 domain-containing protein [Stutzerimonas urumqiensis]